MSYTKEMLENDRVKFTIDVDSEQWKEALNEAYRKEKGKYQVAGFRKGHAPRAFIERLYGPQVFFDEALDIILPKTYDEVLDKEPDLFPVDRPEVSITAITDSTLQYTAEVQLKPTVKLGAYTGLEFTKDKVKVTKEEVSEEINKARDNAGWWEQVTDRPAQMGDRVKIDYVGSVDGVNFDGGAATDYELELGSGTFIPGFEEGVVGMKAGESKNVNVTFPKEYHAENLAGKEAVFVVTAKDITVKKLPELDDEFAKDVSDFDTFKEYEADVKKKIKARKEDAADAALERKMIDTIVENAAVNVPKCMIDDEAEEMINEFAYRLMYQGMNIDDYYKYTGQTPEKLKESYAEPAARTVKTRLVFEQIIKEAGIEVTAEDEEAVYADLAAKQNKSVEEIKKDFNEHYVSYVKNEAMNKKFMAYLKANNTIK